jgi:uncharacterized protein YndB with AHSA1/START domain
MKSSNTLQVTAPGDREIVMTRAFNAPRHLVFASFSKPELLKRWLLGPPGWEMVVCEVAHKVGDRYRYEWRNAEGRQFGTGGVCRELVANERVVHTEKMDGYPSESVVTTVFADLDGQTLVTMTQSFESREVRDMVLKSGQDRGVAMSYDRLEQILQSPESSGTSSEGVGA